jgi:hypothetical protein
MRLYEITTTEQDPILDDANIVALILHYMGQEFYTWVQKNTPFNPNSKYTAVKDTYVRVAMSIKPLAAQRPLDINLILKTLDQQIPVVGLPKWVSARVNKQVEQDKQELAQYGKQYKDWQIASKDFKPKDTTAGSFTIPDEEPVAPRTPWLMATNVK